MLYDDQELLQCYFIILQFYYYYFHHHYCYVHAVVIKVPRQHYRNNRC